MEDKILYSSLFIMSLINFISIWEFNRMLSIANMLVCIGLVIYIIGNLIEDQSKIKTGKKK
jgi:hypothetical protein